MKKKYKMTKFSKALLLIFIVGIIAYFLYSKYFLISIRFKEKDLNVHEEVILKDLVKSVKNAKIINLNDKVDTSKLGNNKMKIKYKNKFKQDKEIVKVFKVVDKEKPNIEGPTYIEYSVGSKDDILSKYKVNDNSDEEIKPIINGSYDLNKEGTYDLSIVAKDSSSNENSLPVKIKVTRYIDILFSRDVPKQDGVYNLRSGHKLTIKNGIPSIGGVIIVNKTYSIPSTYNPGDNQEAVASFNQMARDAKALGLNFFIKSGTRPYARQQAIYNNYVKNDGVVKADTYSARPGHSEHQTGLAFDINSLSGAFGDTKEGKWVASNAYKYGYIIRYPKGKTHITGYIYEPWHIRYVGKDLAAKLYNNGNWITMEEYFGITSKY